MIWNFTDLIIGKMHVYHRAAHYSVHTFAFTVFNKIFHIIKENRYYLLFSDLLPFA